MLRSSAYNKLMVLQRKESWHVPPVVYISAALAGLLLYLVLPQVGHFRSSFGVLENANTVYLLLGLILTSLTFLIAAFIYTLLALKELRYGRTVLIEVATALANRLLPAGIGGLGLHGLYLVRQKHTVSQASAVVSINNALGILGHLLLLAVVLIMRPQDFDLFRFHFAMKAIWFVGVGALVLLAVVWRSNRLKKRLRLFGKHFLASFGQYRNYPIRLVSALSAMLVLTATYTAVLGVAAMAVGVELSISVVFVVFSLGMLGSTISPTPGGLVGAEAGLFAGFVAFHVPDVPALAAVLLFRLLTYWLPLLPGVIALAVARRRRLL